MREGILFAVILAYSCICRADDSCSVGRLAKIKCSVSESAAALFGSGKTRSVTRGAKPEIVVKGTKIFVNDRAIAIGQSLEHWAKLFPGTPICATELLRQSCVWDKLGVDILAEDSLVISVTVFFNIEPWGPIATELPDGTPIVPLVDTRPKHAFPGYFELDGYGIDAQTEFWEIRAHIAPRRNLHCDIGGNCGSTAILLTSGVKIYLDLYRTTSPHGKLATVVIGR